MIGPGYAKTAVALALAFVLLLPGALPPPAGATSAWTATTDRDFSNGTLSSLNLTGSGLAALLTLASEGNWSCINASGPGARNGHGLAAMYNDDKFVLFGGYSNKYHNDTWVFDLSDGCWTQKSPKNSPSPRAYFGLAGAINDDKAVLFGGESAGSNIRETWVYDLSDNNWTRKYPKVEPFATSYLTLCAFSTDDKFLFFGGDSDAMDDQRTWIYDLSDGEWTSPIPLTRPPVGQEQAMAAFPGEDKVLMFGGFDRYKDKTLSATWVYDLGLNDWYQKSPKTVPHARRGASAAGFMSDDKVVMSGGLTLSENATWVYDLSDDQWTQRSPPELPRERDYSPLARLYNANRAVLFGGEASGGQDQNDTWAFDFLALDNAGNFTSAQLSLGGSAELLNLTWNADVPAGTCMTVQLRTAKTTWDLPSEPFLGPGGSNASYYNASGTRPWSGHTGDAAVQFRVYFTTGNISLTPTLYDLTLAYNRLPERPVQVAPDNSSWLTNATPTFRWTFSDADSPLPGGFRWQADTDPGFAPPEYDSGDVASNDTSYTPNASLRDGTLYWRVKARDCDGGWGNWSTGRVVKIDAAPPASFVPVVAPPGWTCVTTPQVSFWTYDNGTGVDRYEASVDGAAFFRVASPFVLPPQRDGAHNVTIRATDRSGFHADATVGVLVDATPPREFVPSLDRSGWVNSSRPVLSFGTADDTSGLDRYEVFIGARSFGTQTSPYVLPVQSNGIRSLTVRAYDRAGNFREGAVSLYVDSEPPALKYLLVEPSGWSSDASPMVQFEAYDNISGLSHCELRADDGAYFTTGSPCRLGPLGDGMHTVTLRAYDMAGNHVDGIVKAFVDAAPPDGMDLSIEGGTQLTVNRSVMLRMQASDRHSGLAGLSFSNDGLDFTSWRPYCVSTRWELTAGDGAKTVHVRVKDLAGNIALTKASIFLATTTAIDRISVAPGSAVIRCGEQVVFKAEGFDGAGNPVGELPVTWSAGGLGTIDPDGLFTAGAMPASGKVSASFMGKTAEAAVTLVPADAPAGMVNIAPVAGRLTAAPSCATVDQSVRVSSEGSADADSDLLQYFFDFGDGLTSGWTENASVEHAYKEAGTYRPRLKVRDPHGAFSDWSPPATVRISATPAGNGGANTTNPAGTPASLYSLALIPIGAAIAAVLIWSAARKKRNGQP